MKVDYVLRYQVLMVVEDFFWLSLFLPKSPLNLNKESNSSKTKDTAFPIPRKGEKIAQLRGFRFIATGNWIAIVKYIAILFVPYAPPIYCVCV